jgi:hypothetical protein
MLISIVNNLITQLINKTQNIALCINRQILFTTCIKNIDNFTLTHKMIGQIILSINKCVQPPIYNLKPTPLSTILHKWLTHNNSNKQNLSIVNNQLETLNYSHLQIN